MKWSVIGLIFVGLLAAVAAAVLVAAIRAGGLKNITQRTDFLAETEALVAAKDIPAMKVIDGASLLTKKIPKKDLPQDPMTSPLQAIGKMFSVPVKGGQVLSKRNLVPEGTGRELSVKAIENGMRAVSVALTDQAGLQGLLYPGSLVDVMASFRGTGGSGTRREAFSLTLLQGIQVLAVADQTVVSSVKQEESKASKETRVGNKRLLVTLKVEPEEAQALQLAMQYGTLSLSLRNPFDKKPVTRPLIQLRDLGLFGLQLASAAPEEEAAAEMAEPGGDADSDASQEPPGSGGAEVPPAQNPTVTSTTSTSTSTEPATGAVQTPADVVQSARESAAFFAGELGTHGVGNVWRMKIIRGTTASEVSFPGLESTAASALGERSGRRVTP